MYEAIVFRKINFTGKHHHIYGEKEGDGDYKLGRTKDMGNATSSIIIKSGEWAFYNQQNFEGTPVVLQPGMYSNVVREGIPDNSVSSIKVNGDSNEPVELHEAILFVNDDFTGKHHHIFGVKEGNGDIRLGRTDGMGNATSSIIIKSGTWEFYDSTNFGGYIQELTPGMYSKVGEHAIPNNTISSVKFIGPSKESIDWKETTLYIHNKYAGKHHHILGKTVGDGDLKLGRTSGVGNTTSSIIVRSGKWSFYDVPNYEGYYKELTTGMYNKVEDFDISNDAVSSVKLVAL